MLQNAGSIRAFFVLLSFFIIGIVAAPALRAQSQALNGQIEGTITDAAGAVVANANVTLRNNETGATRQITTDENGFYRAPILPLGTYSVIVEAANFKRLVREGVTLSAGQIATIDAALETGGAQETVTITLDAPIADAGKIDLGRVMNQREVQNLPLVSRNPYNYSLLQANVTGRPNSEFGVPRINANGYARRTNYQLDGNNNTQADRSGIRLMPISDVFVSEVQLVTNGFAAEFGNTPGLIMNAVTPAGTNGFHGSASYRFRRTPLYARPFFYSSPNDLPKNSADDVTAAIGGPIIKDRWQFYTGYEYVKRGLAVEPQRVITISAANQAALIAAGVPSSAFVAAIPTQQNANFFIVRSDAQLTEQHRLTARYNRFKNLTTDNIAGGITTLQRSVDFDDLSYAGAAQLVSTFSANLLNELRFQYAKRDSLFLPSPNSGAGPSIVIAGVANFGAPEDQNSRSPLETITDFKDNFTITNGEHTIKFGGSISRIYDFRRSGIFSRYTFASLANYNTARTGVLQPNNSCQALTPNTPPIPTRCYSQYAGAFGNPEIEYKSFFYSAFAQDDWKVTQKLKVNYGLRYDLYKVPEANSNSPYTASQNFNVDKNNFAPRLGVVYGLRTGNRPTVLRASAGIYYEPPQIDIYRRAIQNNGAPVYFTFTLAPTAAGAPDFPNSAVGNAPRSVDTVSPDFVNLFATHANFQIEQAITNDLSITGGYIHSSGRHIPVYRNINRINVVRRLDDGRPVFSNGSTAADLLDPRFTVIQMAESVGNSTYNAASVQLNKRFARGYQFSLNYTLSKATDDAPEQNLVAASTLTLSDPTNRRFDFGPSLADQRHTFVASFVGRPQFDIENRFVRALVNNNQLGIIAIANSGERFNITTATDLNLDGLLSDRPVGFTRNSGKTPKQFNVDARYSRFFKFNERFQLEGFVEATNIFNVRSIFQFNNTTLSSSAFPINATTGALIGAAPDFLNNYPALGGATALDSRNIQIGFKFIF